MGKTTTIKRQITIYPVRMAINIVCIILLWFVITQILIICGFLIPANYAEQYIQDNFEAIMNTSELSSSILPDGSTFSVFSNTIDYLYGNMDEDDTEVAKSVAETRNSYLSGRFMYYAINRENEICVVKYSLAPILRIGKLSLSNYNFISVIVIIVFCAICFLYQLNRLTRRWISCFEVIQELTAKIKNRDLQLDAPQTFIREFDQVINSMQDMGNSLVQSLKRQWEIEQMRNQQIASLAHDVKIPLTIIKGNAELMRLAENYQERQEYTQSILLGESRIERYVENILKLSHLNESPELSVEQKSSSEWMALVLRDARELAKAYEQSVIYTEPDESAILELDMTLMASAMMNIIMNACEYSPRSSDIFLSATITDPHYIVKVQDSGPGFSEEALNNATALFFMEDKSRGNLSHYGIGLTMAERIVNLHNGKLTIQNTENHNGCISIHLPLQK